ncbi:MAG: polysaccharide biosynthesis C-terminal domain-containing protein [Oscillospiraceae bacterium]|nr:polysaccharide biosynthesis C-terminal domain-containing protein [Oscillospiraceae bacterium]MBR6561729.1 polysaccharide biosynthesis C-terminal domain-containing protein [Oscillospiraceae bacterium]
MNGNTSLARNTALLTASGLAMRCIALIYQVWLAGRIGSAGIGLFQLIASVQFLSATFAISGIRFASTRLISEEMGQRRPGGVRRVVRLCLVYSLLFGIAAALLLWLGAERIGFLWIGDARTVLSLRIVALSMPFIALSSVFSGYFTSSGRVWKSAAVQVAEQLVRIALVVLFLRRVTSPDIEKSCAAVVLGGSAAELFSFLLNLTLYLFDLRRHMPRGAAGQRLMGRMIRVAVPLALSAYVRTALSTLQHLLIPRGLKASGLSADASLAGYGVIHGMAFPIISFPSCFLVSLSELLVPALTEAQVAGDQSGISRSVNSLIKKCLLFSVGAAALLYANAEALGSAVYHSAEAGHYIRILAWLVPIMYLDTVTDGCLRGLGEQLWCMGVNIVDSAVSVLLVFLLVPRYALTGYIIILIATELFNFILSMYRLRRISQLKLPLKTALLSALCAFGTVQFQKLAARYFPVFRSEALLCAVSVCLSALLYVLLLRMCGVRFGKKNRMSGQEPDIRQTVSRHV